MSRGFTLTELLVVIMVIGLLVAITVPVVNRLTEVTQGGAGVTAISTAVNTARVVNTRLKQPKVDPSMFLLRDDLEVEYRGTAALFTPSGEIRIIWHDPMAAYVNPPVPNFPYLEQDNQHGYVDVPNLDYLNVPRSTSFAGVQWQGSQPRFVPPPFAIRFDASGRLWPPIDINDIILYDSDGDGTKFTYGSGYPSNYDPGEWDHRDRDASERHTADDGRTELPADIIPVVNAVVLFDMTQFRQSGADWSQNWNDENSDLHRFLSNPDLTRPVYFSPLTGMMMKGLTDGTRRRGN